MNAVQMFAICDAFRAYLGCGLPSIAWLGKSSWPQAKDDSGSGSGQMSAGFGSCGFRFRDDFSPTVFGFGFGFGIGFGFGFDFPPVDIQWISEINHLELKLMFYNMLIITCLLRLLNLFKIGS
jgi:hypothetical protein